MDEAQKTGKAKSSRRKMEAACMGQAAGVSSVLSEEGGKAWLTNSGGSLLANGGGSLHNRRQSGILPRSVIFYPPHPVPADEALHTMYSTLGESVKERIHVLTVSLIFSCYISGQFHSLRNLMA